MGALVVGGTGSAAAVPRIKPGPRHPNIILFLSDDQAQRMEVMRYTSARRDWTKFTNAIISNPLCCPSRATILSGLYSNHTRVEKGDQGALFNGTQTIGNWLHRAGYRTGLIGKYLNFYPWTRGPAYRPVGWDDWHVFQGSGQIGQGGDKYYNYHLHENARVNYYGVNPVTDYSTDVLAAKARAFVAQRDPRPFFLYFSPFSPHLPAKPAVRYRGAFSRLFVRQSPNFNEPEISDKPRFWRSLNLVNAQLMEYRRRQHDESLLGLDDAMRRFFTTLAQTGKLRNTVVIYLTDNGFSFGNHRWFGKECQYEECVHVPLWIRYPWSRPRVVSQLVSNVDLAPTIADIAGTRPAIPVDGESIVPLLRGVPRPLHPAILLRNAAARHPSAFWGLRTLRYKYVEQDATGERELYDLFRDHFELRNAARDPAYAGVVAYLHRTLIATRARRPHLPRPPHPAPAG